MRKLQIHNQLFITSPQSKEWRSSIPSRNMIDHSLNNIFNPARPEMLVPPAGQRRHLRHPNQQRNEDGSVSGTELRTGTQTSVIQINRTKFTSSHNEFQIHNNSGRIL